MRGGPTCSQGVEPCRTVIDPAQGSVSDGTCRTLLERRLASLADTGEPQPVERTGCAADARGAGELAKAPGPEPAVGAAEHAIATQAPNSVSGDSTEDSFTNSPMGEMGMMFRSWLQGYPPDPRRAQSSRSSGRDPRNSGPLRHPRQLQPTVAGGVGQQRPAPEHAAGAQHDVAVSADEAVREDQVLRHLQDVGFALHPTAERCRRCGRRVESALKQPV